DRRTVASRAVKILRAAGGLLAAIALSAISDAPAFAQPEPQLEAYFTERSYDPGQSAQLRVRNASSRLTIQIMRAGGERGSTPGHSTLRGVPVGPPAVVRTADGEWAS